MRPAKPSSASGALVEQFDAEGLGSFVIAAQTHQAEAIATNHLAVAIEAFRHRFAAPFYRWARSNVDDKPTPSCVFYPFGGPDFIYPYLLFPHARNYVLVGTEPVGTLHDTQNSVSGGPILDAMKHYLGFSYFITRDLKSHLSLPYVGGVLPLLMAQLHHLKLQPTIVAFEAAGEGDSVRIAFGKTGTRQELHYYRHDLRDHVFSSSSTLHARLTSERMLAIFMKSASYLLREPIFDTLRHLVLDHTSLLVQDPSGLDYAILRERGWSVDLHGRFVADIPVFSKYDQTALADAFRARTPSVLDFGIGYLTAPDRSALIVATPPTTELPAAKVSR